MICPCKDCEKKGCGEYHSKCEKYLKYAEWKNQINEKERVSKRLSYKSKYIGGKNYKLWKN